MRPYRRRDVVGDASVTRGAAFQNEPGGPAAGAPATYILGQSGWLSPRPSWSPLPPRSGVGETSTDSALSAVSPSPFPHAGRRSRRGAGRAMCSGPPPAPSRRPGTGKVTGVAPPAVQCGRGHAGLESAASSRPGPAPRRRRRDRRPAQGRGGHPPRGAPARLRQPGPWPASGGDLKR